MGKRNERSEKAFVFSRLIFHIYTAAYLIVLGILFSSMGISLEDFLKIFLFLEVFTFLLSYLGAYILLGDE